MFHRIAALAVAALWAVVFGFVVAFAPPSVAILAAGWAALAIFEPRVYLATLLASLPFFGNNPGGPHHLYLLDLGLMAFVARHFFLRGTGRVARRPHPADPWIGLFVVASFFTLAATRLHLYCEWAIFGRRFLHGIYNHYSGASMFGLRACLDLALAVGLFAALRDDPPPPAWRRALLATAVGTAAVAAFVGLLEYAGVVSLEWWRPENANIARFGYRRLQSIFWHSGWYAQYAAILAPAALAFAATATGARSRRVWPGVAGLLLLCQALTMQRGGWIAMGAGCATVAALAARAADARTRRRLVRGAVWGAGGAAVALALLAAVNAPFRSRVREIAAFRDRAVIWQGAVGMIARFPLTGVGMGNYAFAHSIFYPPDHPAGKADDTNTAHNTWLHLFAERGVFAPILFTGLLAGGMVAASRRIRRGEGSDARGGDDESARTDRLVALAAAGGLAALAADGLFQFVFYMRVTEILFWTTLAFAFAPASAGVAETVSEENSEAGANATGRRRLATLPRIAFAVVVATLAIANIPRYGPWTHYAGGKIFLNGGEVVRLPVPAGSVRVSIPLFSLDPAIRESGTPVVFAVWQGDRYVGSHRFTDYVPADVVVALPRPAAPGERLTVRASRVWRPFESTQRRIPILESGVCYGTPTRLE